MTGYKIAIRPSFPWPAPARCARAGARSAPKCSCWTSRSAALDARVRDRLRTLAAVGCTTSARDQSLRHARPARGFRSGDQVIVLNHGKVEQMGAL